MSGATLEVRNLSLSFGAFQALSDVNFHIPAGGVHAFIGPNGAGKTSLFNCITGLRKPSTGSIQLDGVNMVAMSPQRRVRQGLARSFQVTNIFPDLTVVENVRLCIQALRGTAAFNVMPAARSQATQSGEAMALLEELALHPHALRSAASLPHGLQRRLEIAMALAANPRVLLLDEPTSGMGVDDLREMTELIGRLGDTRTVILIEHNIKLVMSISQDVTVLHRGSVLVSGEPQAVAGHPEVKSAYLGSQGPC